MATASSQHGQHGGGAAASGQRQRGGGKSRTQVSDSDTGLAYISGMGGGVQAYRAHITLSCGSLAEADEGA